MTNHDGPHALTDWYPYSKTEKYRDCRIQFCPHYEVRDVNTNAVSVREAATFSLDEPSGNSKKVDSRVRFYPTAEGNFQEVKEG